MQDESTRNTIIFIVCAIALLIVYQQFVVGPGQKKHEAELAQQRAQAAAQHAAAPSAPVIRTVSREQALAVSPRVPVATPSLKGSISLRGGRLDDLFLTKYAQTTDKGSPPVELLKPEGVQYA